MSIKTKYIITYISILVPIIAIIGFFSIGTDAPMRNFIVIISLVLLLERICLRMEKILFSYYYKKYLSVLNKELNPEKFLKLTETEYKSSRNRKYKNYMKINYVKGYLALNEIQKAYNYLMLIDLSDKKYGLPQDMRPIYYYNMALVLYNSGKKDEAIKAYEKNILPYKDSLSQNRKNREMRKSIRFLETFLFNENDNEKMIQGLTESLENVKIRKNIIERKYFLAIYKERNGNMEEAEKLYKEVVKKGNKLHIAGEAKKKLENLNNSRNMDKTDSTTDSIKETDENNQNERSQTVDIDEKGIDKIELKG